MCTLIKFSVDENETSFANGTYMFVDQTSLDGCCSIVVREVDVRYSGSNGSSMVAMVAVVVEVAVVVA